MTSGHPDFSRIVQAYRDRHGVDLSRMRMKKASSKKETWESGEGEVESYTPDRTEDHDEIVIRLNDGRRVRISNNTRLGKLLRAKSGSRVGYHGYRVKGTNVVHKVHPNRMQRGGWLEMKKSAAYMAGFLSKCAERGFDGGRLLKLAEGYGAELPGEPGGSSAGEGKAKVIVRRGDDETSFSTFAEAAAFIASRGPASESRVERMLSQRQTEINGFSVEYPAADESDSAPGAAEQALNLAKAFNGLTGSYGTSSYGGVKVAAPFGRTSP